mgnify:FL=1
MMEKEKITLEKGLQREWIVTNGIGGYASSTIVGVNTRKYHGLLIAPFNAPGCRNLILSKLDESIKIDDKEYKLYSNICKDYISDGYKNIISFEKEYMPIFTYRVEDVIVKKFICMEYGKNTTVVYYYIKNQNSNTKLTLAPIVNCRDFHSVNNKEHINLMQDVKNNKVKMVVNDNTQHPIYMNLSDGTYIKHDGDMFRGMYYIEEEKRGQEAVENHVVPGRYEVELAPNEEKYISFVCSLEENIEEKDGREIISKEVIRFSELTYDSELLDPKVKESTNPEYVSLVKEYITASDNFVVYRPSFALYTLIAGYPWFLDWGRDSLISFEGLLLKSKRYNVAREVLLTCIRDMKYGLIPNGYSGYDNRPLYNSADASLLLFEQVKKYLNYTGEYEWIKDNIYPSLEKVIEAYTGKIDIDGNNIYMDDDYLISSGTENIQNTWMDAKIGDYVVTPRNGKAVEINSMWYNALKIMEELTILTKGKKDARKYADMAERCKDSFEAKFYNKRRKCLYDVLGDSKIRPNQLFSLSLSYPVIDPSSEIANDIISTVEKKLLTPYGLKTLAKGEEGYKESYEGDMVKRDMSYHQGTIWPWLLGLYYDALDNMIKSEKKKSTKQELEKKRQEFKEEVRKTFVQEMNENSTVGNIRELYSKIGKDYKPDGTFAQAWSVSEIFRIIL